jgi:hypothetical protein
MNQFLLPLGLYAKCIFSAWNSFSSTLTILQLLLIFHIAISNDISSELCPSRVLWETRFFLYSKARYTLP